MNLQISYDFTNLTEAIEVAKKTAYYADIIEIGTPLLFSEGVNAVKTFRKEFPNKKLLADMKLVDRVEEVISLYGTSGVDYITVLGVTTNNIIRKATTIAHKHNVKIILDLFDIYTLGQTAKDASTLEVDGILFHSPYDTESSHEIEDKWEIVRGNTTLPIFVAEKINKESIKNIIKLKPDGILIGKAITRAANPEEVAKEFHNLIHNK